MKKYLLISFWGLISSMLWGQELSLNSAHVYLDSELGLILVNEDLASLNAAISSVSSMLINGQSYDLSSPQDSLQLGQAYGLSDGPESLLLFFTELPIIRIDTTQMIMDEPRVLAELELTETDGSSFSSWIGVEYRGGSSQNYDKKSLRIEIWEDELGEGTDNEALLGMRSDDDWNLQAAWIEPLRMRNMVSWDLWQDLHQLYYLEDEDEARSYIDGAYVELFIGDGYQGLYQLTERMDRKQLKLKKYDEEEGLRGELFKAVGHGNTQFNSLPPIPSQGNRWGGWEIDYPDPDDVPLDWSGIYDFVAFARNSSTASFQAEIDNWLEPTAAVDYFLFMNILRGYDNTGKNTFLARYDSGEPLVYIPWDLDAVFGLDWQGQFAPWYSSILSHHLYDRLLESCGEDEFAQRAAIRWDDLREDLLTTEAILSRFNYYHDYLSRNAVYTRESLKWEDYSYPGNHLAELEVWLDNRLNWLDSYFDDLCDSRVGEPGAINFAQLYPNPVGERLHIRIADYRGPVDYQLLDAQGRVVNSGSFNAPMEYWLSTDGFAAGWYQLHLQADRKNQQSRLIIR
ncbi:MAG: CotH kinase family protein [Bacteroidota bacterium]